MPVSPKNAFFLFSKRSLEASAWLGWSSDFLVYSRLCVQYVEFRGGLRVVSLQIGACFCLRNLDHKRKLLRLELEVKGGLW